MNHSQKLLSLTAAALFGSLFVFSLLACNQDDDDDSMMMDPPITDTMMVDTMDTDTMALDTVGMISDTVRFASFNVSMFGNEAGQVIANLSTSSNFRYKKVAEIIQRVRPDVLALMEFDYDESGQALPLFQQNYLNVSQNLAEAIAYEYAYAVPTNTGLLSDTDIDGNGNISLPNDAYGFGTFEGQYGFAILSKYPIDENEIRSFQTLLWKDMPNANLPMNGNESYYSEDALDAFRISSKNHIDIPIQVNENQTIHALLAHPTPPVFDGAEDRNGLRNFDEIRLWVDYLNNESYLQDDNGGQGGLTSEAAFVVMGDLNSDPVDGDSVEGSINQLLDHNRVNQAVANGSLIPQSLGGTEHNQQSGDESDPAFDTSFFGLRTDYVLPSDNLNTIATGVFWPLSTDQLSYLTAGEASSDHLLVWIDLVVE